MMVRKFVKMFLLLTKKFGFTVDNLCDTWDTCMFCAISESNQNRNRLERNGKSDNENAKVETAKTCCKENIVKLSRVDLILYRHQHTSTTKLKIGKEKRCNIRIPDAVDQQQLLNSMPVRFLILVIIWSEALSLTNKYALLITNCQRILQRSQLQLGTFYLLLCVNFCFATKDKGHGLSVKLMNPPLKMGQRAELECIIRIKSVPTVRSWTKIPNGETIAYQNIAFNASKYALSIENQLKVIKYNLIIFYFGLADLNCRYKCDADFYSDSVTLGCNTHDFVAIPNSSDVLYNNVSISEGILSGSIHVNRIYPKPGCTATFAGKNITSGLNIEHTGTNMVLNLQANSEECDGYLKIICEIGERSYPFSIENFMSGCIENTSTFPAYIVYLIVAVAVILVLLFFRFTFCSNCIICTCDFKRFFISPSEDIGLHSGMSPMIKTAVERSRLSITVESRMI